MYFLLEFFYWIGTSLKLENSFSLTFQLYMNMIQVNDESSLINVFVKNDNQKSNS